ncbi:hypothetical protein H6G33_32535 [Calothrix sp. FACHB-1219]|nr:MULTISPECIES: hypothetical protein [unclassified Calothrix]MBD2207080.1 hypothetical protein [Calothrix sp. FACHB-168]MBD2221697.1 hypothetical protein [Calothrix sp. FACHB-1219]
MNAPTPDHCTDAIHRVSVSNKKAIAPEEMRSLIMRLRSESKLSSRF